MVEILTQLLMLAQGKYSIHRALSPGALTNPFHFYYGALQAEEPVVNMATESSLKADTQKPYLHTECGWRPELKWVIYRTVW